MWSTKSGIEKISNNAIVTNNNVYINVKFYAYIKIIINKKQYLNIFNMLLIYLKTKYGNSKIVINIYANFI